MKKSNKIKDAIENLKSDDLAKVVEAVNNGNLSNEAIGRITKDFDNLVLEACKTKINFELRFLLEDQPDISLRDALVKMLNSLPSDVDAEFIPILTEFVLEKWKLNSQNLAA